MLAGDGKPLGIILILSHISHNPVICMEVGDIDELFGIN